MNENDVDAPTFSGNLTPQGIEELTKKHNLEGRVEKIEQTLDDWKKGARVFGGAAVVGSIIHWFFF